MTSLRYCYCYRPSSSKAKLQTYMQKPSGSHQVVVATTALSLLGEEGKVIGGI